MPTKLPRVVVLLAFLVPAVWAAPAEARQPEVQVLADLVVPGPRVPHCGGMHFIVGMHYRVVTVVSGTLAHREIDVAVSCPELHRVRFQAGQRHRLTLVARKPWTTGGLVPDRNRTGNRPLLWALRVGPAAPAVSRPGTRR